MNITLDEIRSNAPDGATHYNHRTETYYKEGDKLYYWEGEWRPSWYGGSEFMIYIKPL